MSATIFLTFFEFAVCLYSALVCRFRFVRLSRLKALVASISFLTLLVSILLGGSYAIVTAVKVFAAVAVSLLAFKKPKAAAGLLVGLTILNLFVKALQGEIATKWSTVPFFLWATCWLYLSEEYGVKATIGVLVAVTLEATQAWWVDSRSTLITLGLVFGTCALPIRSLPLVWRWLARGVPIIYLAILVLILLSFASDEPIVEPTASNVERSTLAFWSFAMVPDHIFKGPGPDAFFENVNGALMTAGRQRDDDGIDPHSFLLSYWVGLGAVMAVCIYLAWWNAWGYMGVPHSGNGFMNRLPIASFASVAVVSFTLSPPDTVTRMITALCLGIVLSETSNDSSLEKVVRP